MVNGWLDEINSLHLVEPWQTNTLNSSYWDAVQIVDDYAKVHTPAFHIGGYYDVFARGIIDGFLGYQNQGGEGAAGHQHLVLGPWVHAINDPRAGELTFGQAVLGELYDEWQPMWFEACLGRSADIGRLDALATVTYFVMGAVGENDAPGNEWRTASTWPPEGYEETRVYLYSGNTLTTELPGEDSGGDTFAYDPIDPAPTICGRTMQIEAGSCDQRPVEGRDDVLVYTSTALEEPLEVTGDVRAEIWFTTDVLDTDIVVRLTDVYPDGRSMLIVDGIVRARYHNSPDFAAFELLETDRPYPVTLDLGPTSIILNKGHRLRVSVTSSNWPCFSVNPNTGESFLLEGEQGRIAHTTILHDAAHPSAIVLPVK
jgi:hypothetical protein